MKKKIGRIVGSFLLIFAVLYSEIVFASGTGMLDLQKGTGEIELLGNTGQTLKGTEWILHKILECEASSDGQTVCYHFHSPYEQAVKKVVGERSKQDPSIVTEEMAVKYMETYLHASEKEFRGFIDQIRKEIEKEKIPGERIQIQDVKEDGSFSIQGLAYGYYLLDEVTPVAGTHRASSLCMVDTVSGKVQIHVKSDYPSITKKIQEDDDQEQIGKDGWNDIADFQIGQKVPYKFTSDVPNMKGYETYHYIWHDRMEGALSFQKESVAITIEDQQANKSYPLLKEEFEITNNIEGETFQVRIPDLKKIVEREFGQDAYGQKVSLRYDAVLNEQAAKDTGRPGFENDVKLEFSNNPDYEGEGQTGQTPWDTVVCFTYKINGIKEDDKKNRLEGAKFQLYLEEECKTKVLEEVQSGKDGTFTIAGLDRGTYWLKEIKAPEGYRPLERPVKIEIIPSYTEQRNVYIKGEGETEKTLKTLNIKAEGKELVTDVEEGSGNLLVVDQTNVKLPVTGSAAVSVLAGVGFLLMSAALFLRKRDEK